MPITFLALSLFCALISGWTAALAQIQTLGSAGPAHHVQQDMGSSAERACPTAGKACDHPVRMVHPLLCAACFAVSVQTFDIERDDPQTTALRPQPQTPMRESAVKPQFPPPKASMPIA